MIRSDDFDIDEWINLAKQDESAFELKRNECIKKFIQEAPEKYHKRMSGMQWTIDMERKLAGSPLSSCMKIYSKMWHSMAGKDGLSEKMNSFIAYVDSPDVYLESASAEENVITSNVVRYR